MSDEKVRISGPTTEVASVDVGIPEELGVLPLRESVLFPNLALPVLVGRERSIRLIEEAAQGDRLLVAVTVTPVSGEDEPPDPPPAERMYKVGTLARIAELMRLPNGTVQVALQGMQRVAIDNWLGSEPYLRAAISTLPDTGEDDAAEAKMRTVMAQFRHVAELAPYIPQQFAMAAMNIREPSDFANFLSANLNIVFEQKQQQLEETDVKTRLEELERYLQHELDVLELSLATQEEISEDVARMHREQFLRRQLDLIKRELGEYSGEDAAMDELAQRVADAKMPEEARKAAERELERLEVVPSASPEYGVIRTYVEWLCDVPWSSFSDTDSDIAAARAVLDADHWGLSDVKDRILEFLAVASLRPDRRSPILCFVGPPGVGKTSLGQSIARALGRQFVRMSLGGVRDEAEIRGHRRTYIGALPGRIVQGLKRAGTINPVMMLDEIDKLGMDFRGDPSSALLEVLDPQQNNSFSDHYLEVPVDLSNVMFICTANQLEPIPGPLRDRMEIIELRGYTIDEKVQIARRHLVPRQLSEHGLKRSNVAITVSALRSLVAEYTWEAGVRTLERTIGTLLRKVAVKVASGEATEKITIKPDDLEELLGPAKLRHERIPEVDSIGIVNGLAWTPVGGDILNIEVVPVAGKGTFTLTGQLGDVMQESARAALTYVRSRASDLGADAEWFEKRELHVHVPAGAVPKDGPSAGIAMATAMASAISGIPVARKVAMTGEITLQGRVLPIGGLKEKVIAAHRAGVRTVLLPSDNEPQLSEIPENVRNKLDIHLVSHMDEVLRLALTKPIKSLTKKSK